MKQKSQFLVVWANNQLNQGGFNLLQTKTKIPKILNPTWVVNDSNNFWPLLINNVKKLNNFAHLWYEMVHCEIKLEGGSIYGLVVYTSIIVVSDNLNSC